MKSSRSQVKPSVPAPLEQASRPGRPSSTDWLVTSRPSPRRKTIPASSAPMGSSSCFPAGSLVTMADGTTKTIEKVRVGDQVVGLSGIVEVYGVETPVLGDRTLLRMADGSLKWSAEHAFWVRRGHRQWFGTHDKAEFDREARLGLGSPGLQNSPEDVWTLARSEEAYAHASGWKKQRAVAVPARADLPLYYIRTTGCHTLLVNGYVVSGCITDADFDYTKVNWQGLAAFPQFCRAA